MDGVTMTHANLTPVFPKAETMFLHSGNICTWHRLQKKLSQSPTLEVMDCIEQCFSDFLEKADRTVLQYADRVTYANDSCIEKMAAEGEDVNEDLKLTVKVFIYDADAASLTEAVGRVREDLRASSISSLLVAFPQTWEPKAAHRVWTAVEELVQQELVINPGVSDFSMERLSDLYEWAAVKPTIDQVNLSSCCVIPADLTAFAKEKDIRLLSHNDPPEIITDGDLQQLITRHFTEADGSGWHLSWVTRYSVLIKDRGIIKSKGYMVKAKRSVKVEPPSSF